MIYTAARWANPEQTEVIGTDANGNTERRPIDKPHEWRRPEEFLTGFLAQGGVVDPYQAPPVIITPPRLGDGGLARFTGPAPSMVLEAIGIAGVTRISKGRYRVVHESPMPSDQYSVLPAVMDALPRSIRVTARTAAYVEIRVTDLDGAVQDPAEATVRTERVVT